MIILYWLLSLVVYAQTSGEAVQIPAVVQLQLNTYQERFQQILAEECPAGICTAAGCDVSQFLTLDQQQDSSLPGLETPSEQTSVPQYKLVGIRCEFAHEAKLSTEGLNSLKQRLQMKIKSPGTTLSLVARKLAPKSAELEISNPSGAQAALTPLPNQENSSASSLNETLPWMAILVVATAMLLLLIWGYRSIARARSPLPSLKEEGGRETSSVDAPEPTASMVMARIKELREKLLTPGNQALKPLLASQDIESLCALLLHFGSEPLAGFSKGPEFQDVLKKLGLAFRSYAKTNSNLEIWNFLEKLDRLLIANELSSGESTLEEEAVFLQTLGDDEFFNLLQIISEEDLPLALSLAPHSLQRSFFHRLDSVQVENLVEKIGQAQKLPDKIAREKLTDLRQVYLQHRSELRRISVDRLSLMEQLVNSLKTSKERTHLFKRLQTADPNFAHKLLANAFIDESLLLLPEESLNEIFLQIAPEIAAAYLDSLSFGEKVLSRLKPQLRQVLERRMRNHDVMTANINFQIDSSFEFLEGTKGLTQEILKESNLGRSEVAQQVKLSAQKGQINLVALNERLMDGIL